MSEYRFIPLPLSINQHGAVVDAHGERLCVYGVTSVSGSGISECDASIAARDCIVRAVNSHAQLLAACKEARRVAREAQRYLLAKEWFDDLLTLVDAAIEAAETDDR